MSRAEPIYDIRKSGKSKNKIQNKVKKEKNSKQIKRNTGYWSGGAMGVATLTANNKKKK